MPPLDPLTPFVRGSGFLHRAPVPAKLAGAAGIVLVVALAPRDAWALYAVAALALSATVLLSGLPPLRVLGRLLIVQPFAVGTALLSLLQPGGGPVFLALLAKSTLCLLTFVLLGMSTSPSDLLEALRRLRVPALVLITLALTYRYLFLLLEESDRMQRARLSRSAAPRARLGWWLSATVIAQLFVRSTERAERVYAAMCARGFDRARR